MSAAEREDRAQEESASPLDSLRAALAGSHDELRATLESMHEADIAEAMLDLTERESWYVFDSLDRTGRADVLSEAEDPLREQLLDQLTPRQIAGIVEGMPADDAVDLLALAGPDASERVLRTVDFERAKDLRELAAHPHDTAGGMMTTEFVTVVTGSRIGDAIKLLKYEADEVEEGQGIFVVDEGGRPTGYVPDRELLTHSIHEIVDEVMADPIMVPVQLDQEEVAHQIVHYGLNEIAVVDANGVLIGVVTSDDAQEVLEEEASEDLLRIVGTSPELQTRLSILKRVRVRLPLQGLTVVGGLLTAWIIDLWIGEGSKGTDLLRFIPIIIGLAGNVGIQASTILVRAFATGEVEPEREASVLASETAVGLIIGLICGAATFLAQFATGGGEEGLRFAMAVGAAIAVAVTWAAFLGCVVPMTCRRIGIDPAIVAGPFLITVSDISGTALYLGVAGIVVGL